MKWLNGTMRNVRKVPKQKDDLSLWVIGSGAPLGDSGGDTLEKSPLVHKSIYSNIARNIMNTFVRLTEEIFGRLIQYNVEQEQTATKYVQDGLTLDKAEQVIRKGLMHMRNNNMEPPRTIYWFEKAFFPNRYKRLKNMNTNEVINKLTKKLRMPR